jgi:CheY-like chemotaxis protein
MMKCNYVSVSEACSIAPWVQFIPSHASNFFQPLDRDRSSDDLLPDFDEDSPHDKEAKPRALVVDDVADVTEMLSTFLTLAGYEVITSHSAQSAIEVARCAHFDVIVSDIGMPQMDGYELAQALRAIPGYESVPLVAVTGFSRYDDRERSLQSGFTAHLTKPIDPNVLFQLLERLRGQS